LCSLDIVVKEQAFFLTSLVLPLNIPQPTEQVGVLISKSKISAGQISLYFKYIISPTSNSSHLFYANKFNLCSFYSLFID